MRRLVVPAVVAVLVAVCVGGALVVALFASVLTGTTAGSVAGTAQTQPESCAVTLEAGSRTVRLDDEQRANAAVIVATGRALGVPRRGWVIALATAMQESTLRNLDYGDRDSLGLFQQRPSQGWGSPAQVRDPDYAARQFFTRLLSVPGWEQLPATVAAQTVQRSAFPNAYAKWEPLAAGLVTGVAPSTGARGCDPQPAVSLPDGDTGAMLRAVLAQEGDPYVFGATGPDAFDCSGLLVYAWRQAGRMLTVRTADQMYRSSTAVSPGSEQPGDIIFREFGTRVPGAGHMQIVVEPGLVIEAPSAGKNVRLRPYDPHAPGQRIGRLDPDVLVPVAGPDVGS